MVLKRFQDLFRLADVDPGVIGWVNPGLVEISSSDIYIYRQTVFQCCPGVSRVLKFLVNG